MLVLVNKEGDIVEEGGKITNPSTGDVGVYTGWMPPHSRNEHGLAYVQFEGKEWEDSFLPYNLDCKLVDI